MEVAREVGTRWRASQLRVPVKIIGVRLIACSCSTCKQTDMVSLSTFIPMFDEMGTNMTGSSCSRQPLGLWAGFMLLHNHSVFSVFLLGYYIDLLCFIIMLSPFPTQHQTARNQCVVDSVIHLFHSVLHSFIPGRVIIIAWSGAVFVVCVI